MAFPALGSVLVTGGCGFLGSHIVDSLLGQSQQSSIHVLDLKPPLVAKDGVTYHAGDLTSIESLRSILGIVKPTIIIHTASPVFKSGGGKKARDFMWEVNVHGTKVLMDEARKTGTSIFIYTSSASVVSDTKTDLINADERWSYVLGEAQLEYYSETKAEAELLVLDASTRHPAEGGVPFLTAAIRPASMFGERDVQMVPPMLETLQSGKSHFQLGANDNLFDFTYVGNVAHAHLLAAERLFRLSERLAADPKVADEPNLVGKVDGEAFIITNQTPVYFWDFARALWNAYYNVRPTKKPPATIDRTLALSKDLALLIAYVLKFLTSILGQVPARLQPSSVRYACMTRYFGTRKATALLNYQPVYTLDQGIDRTVKWFAAQEEEKQSIASKEEKKDR